MDNSNYNNTEDKPELDFIKDDADEAPEEKPSDKKRKKEKEKKSAAREVFDWVEIIALSLAFVLLMFSYVARQARVEGDSMMKTFHDGETIIISDLLYTPKQNDIVVFQKPNAATGLTEPIIKRVIAVSGQTVYIDFKEWKVYVYDDSSLTVDEVKATVQPLDEPYIEAMRETVSMEHGSYTYPLTVEEGKVFCMGDNRNHSLDSRFSSLGQIDERYILGKVLFRIYPLSFKF